MYILCPFSVIKRVSCDDLQRNFIWSCIRSQPKRQFCPPSIVSIVVLNKICTYNSFKTLPKRLTHNYILHYERPRLYQHRPARPINHEYYDYLSTPRRPIRPYTGPTSKISDPVRPIPKSVLNFEMTPAYEWLATPFKPVQPAPDIEPYENPYEPPRELRKIKGTGLPALAEPRVKTKRFVKGDNASVVFEVSEFAKKAKPSEATKKLAEPRKDIGKPPKANAFAVSKSALKPLKGAKLIYYNKMSEPVVRSNK